MSTVAVISSGELAQTIDGPGVPVFCPYFVDPNPPIISNEVPAVSSIGQLLPTNISFHLDDLESGVDCTTIDVWVKIGAGVFVPAVVNGVNVAPFNGPGSSLTFVPPKGCDVVIDPLALLPYRTTVMVRVYVEDFAGNVLDVTYSFVTEAFTPNFMATPLLDIPDFPLEAYRFIIKEIRVRDLQGSPRPGSEFLLRYMQGPQALWKHITADIQRVPALWDVIAIRDQHLTFLKHIVGWTDETRLKQITDAIDDDALRRLIAASAELWSKRGPEATIVNVLRLLTSGARLRIWNWFDFRWVLDETELGEEHEGRDPWIIDLPSSVDSEVLIDSWTFANLATGNATSVTIPLGVSGSVENRHVFRIKSGPQNGLQAEILGIAGPVVSFIPDVSNQITGPFAAVQWEIVNENYLPDDEYKSNLRIVDNGTLDRTLVKRVLRLMRAAGERFDITYLSFLDLFAVPFDNLQWALNAAGPIVDAGTMQLIDDAVIEQTYAIVPEAADWAEYAVTARMKGNGVAAGDKFGLLFYFTDALNYYFVSVDTAAQFIRLEKLVAGVPTVIVAVDLNVLGFNILPDVYYAIRATVVVEGAANRIVVFVDGATLINTTDAAHTEGSVGLRHSINATLICDEVEVVAIPADTDTLAINEVP